MRRTRTGPLATVRGQSGGIGMRIVMAIVTLAILGGGVVFVVRSFQAKQQVDLRHAEQISIDGLQEALMRLQSSPSWRGPVPRTESGDSWYQVTVAIAENAGIPQLTVTAEGHSRAAVRRQICVLHLSMTGTDSAWVQQSLKQE
jgi:hypothetical protein